MISEVSNRYARALFEIAQGTGRVDLVFSELRVLSESFKTDSSVGEFFNSPLVSSESKMNVIKNSLSGKVSEEVLNTILLLADNNRLFYFNEIAQAFEKISDDSHGVTRGQVTSASTLSQDERKKISETVQKITGKKVILGFQEDSSLLGGMVAQVGGWTFDDSLQSHLTRMKEELNRRTH